MIRRAALLVAASLLAGCAAVAPHERIVEQASGREVSRAELLAALRSADFVLLGELHDNPWHHRRRGELVAELGAVPVVAEHLNRGQAVHLGPDLLASLQAAGFDAPGWQWPMHEPLFDALRRAGGPLVGGNLERDLVRRIARDGTPPPALAAVIAAAPLAPAAQAALDEDLEQGHCGQLSAARLPAMRQAQRARDASMALAMQALVQAHGPHPVVLVAGNGHVRLDYGVPRMLTALAPAARTLSVAFGEAGGDEAPASANYLWITPRQPREDPCDAMTRR